jgi:two-component system KDP operon response regulator KdpE
MSNKPKILVADDEPNIRMFVRANLVARDYDVILAKDGCETLELAERFLPDVIVLDINMPGLDGIEVCRRIRSWTDIPIMMLSVRGDDKDKVRALNEGADDYVTKPFSIEELLARIKVAIKHAVNLETSSPVVIVGDLEIDLGKRAVKRRGTIIKLTRTEYRLLALMVSNLGKVLDHMEILHSIWGPEYGQEREYVRVFIGQLRHKLEDDPLNPRYIITEQGMGYRFLNPG